MEAARIKANLTAIRNYLTQEFPDLPVQERPGNMCESTYFDIGCGEATRTFCVPYAFLADHDDPEDVTHYLTTQHVAAILRAAEGEEVVICRRHSPDTPTLLALSV